jgi:DNA polymerase elongation subunit (family B)
MSEAAEWKEANKKMIDVYGDIRPEVAFIAENYIGDMFPQKAFMNIYAIDIECIGHKGFPKAANPEDFISCVTFLNMVTKQYYVLGLVDFKNTRRDVHYYKCRDEKHLLLSIADFVRRQEIDIITGWYSTAFDIPYIVERMELVLGEGASKDLSPTHKIRKGTKIVNKKEVTVYDIHGIIALDYLDMYQKFTFENKETYNLDFIAKAEGVGGKLEFKEDYGDLTTLYNQNPQLYIEYNIMDVELIDNLDMKLKFIDLAISYAYMMKCDIGNIFGTVAPWDALLYSELRGKGILVPPLKANHKEDYVGGFVAEPKRGRVKWVSVYDIVSSYPNTICSYNISPDTIINTNDLPEDLYRLICDMTDIEDYYNLDDPKLAEITKLLKKYSMCLCANGTVYTTERMGFLTDIVGRIFADRKKVKGQIKALKNKGPGDNKAQYDLDLGVLENKSQVLKIAVNSVYGALANEYFRFFDIRLACAITSSAQVSNKGVTRYITTRLPDISLVYGDTDSNFLSFEKTVAKRYPNGEPDPETVTKFILKYQEKVLEPVINRFFVELGDTFNMYQRTIQMEAECIADVSIFVEKKKYAMHQLWKEGEWFIEKPKLKIKGIEVVRSSTPAVVRTKLKEALGLMFGADNESLIDFVESFKKEFYKMGFDAISFPRGVNFWKTVTDARGNETMEEYTIESKSLPIAVRASFVFNKALEDNHLEDKYLQISTGSKIKFCYIKKPNKFRSDVIGVLAKMPEEFNNHFKIDYDTQWEKAFAAPLTKILDCIGWTIEYVQTLEDFFS